MKAIILLLMIASSGCTFSMSIDEARTALGGEYTGVEISTEKKEDK